MNAIRLLLVDDHPLFRKGLARLFEKDRAFTVVGEAADGADAIRKAQALAPDLVLMDIHMPGVDGLEATRAIAAELPKTRVVMLTVSEEDKDLFDAIACGAYGYVLKTVEPETLFAQLKGVFRGEAPVSSATAARILRRFAQRSHARHEPADDLTERERQVLALLASGRTNKEIGASLGIAENTVKNHLKSILAKLHLDNRVQAAALAIRQGLIVPKRPAK